MYESIILSETTAKYSVQLDKRKRETKSDNTNDNGFRDINQSSNYNVD